MCKRSDGMNEWAGERSKQASERQSEQARKRKETQWSKESERESNREKEMEKQIRTTGKMETEKKEWQKYR